MSRSETIFAWVPGLPHLLNPELSPSYETLSKAYKELGHKLQKQGVQRILYYSTQWISVLGQSVQYKKHLHGIHIDENWHQLKNLPFDLHIDLEMADLLIKKTNQKNLQVRSVDYEGFPIDTGTIVANHFLNENHRPVGIYSCCVYSDHEETKLIGKIAQETARELPGKTAIVAISGLSSRFFTTDIDYREDHISNQNDNQKNQQFIQHFLEKNWDAIEKQRGEYARSCKVDMDLKALSFLEGAGLKEQKAPFKNYGYGPIYGTGAAIIGPL